MGMLTYINCHLSSSKHHKCCTVNTQSGVGVGLPLCVHGGSCATSEGSPQLQSQSEAYVSDKIYTNIAEWYDIHLILLPIAASDHSVFLCVLWFHSVNRKLNCDTLT